MKTCQGLALIFLLLMLSFPGFAIDLNDLTAEARNGSIPAQKDLAKMYLLGVGAIQDYQEAAKWFELAASNGDSDSQFQLGYLYLNGMGVARNKTKAEFWFEKAANQNHKEAEIFYKACVGVADAEYDVALRYEQENKFIEAIDYLNSAIKKGHPASHYEYGRLYGLGYIFKANSASTRDSEKLFTEQDKWFRLSAQLGFPRGQLYVAEKMLQENKLVEAFAWANLAAVKERLGQALRDKLSQNMSFEQQTEGQTLSKQLLSEIDARLSAYQNKSPR